MEEEEKFIKIKIWKLFYLIHNTEQLPIISTKDRVKILLFLLHP